MIRELLETVISAGIISFIIITFIGQVTVVRGASMEPTLHNNERLIADKISYRFETPNRSEIIIFRPPLEIKRNYIKRVIGIPGDTVMVKNGRVHLNGQLLDQWFLPDDFVTRSGNFAQEGIEKDSARRSIFMFWG